MELWDQSILGRGNGHTQTRKSMCDLGREHRRFWVAGTEPVQRPGGEELREVRAGVEV